MTLQNRNITVSYNKIVTLQLYKIVTLPQGVSKTQL